MASTRLRLDAATIADIFLGKITSWDHARIAALNPGVKLPKMDLIVVHRSDGSGTTFVFADYLSKVSPEWKTKVGASTSIAWPIGLGGKGSEGVTQQIKQIEGSLGYVELVYASSNKLPVALVSNSAGKFVEPSLEAVTAAAAGAKLEKGTDFRVSLTNAPGDKSYPIASYTWLLVKMDSPDAARAKTLRDFLSWMITARSPADGVHSGLRPAAGRRGRADSRSDQDAQEWRQTDRLNVVTRNS